MQRITLLTAIILVSLLADSAHAQESLAWKFKEGDRFYLEEKTTVKESIKVLGNTEEKEEVQLNVVSFVVQKKTADSVVLVQTIEELTTDVKKGNADPMAQQMLDKMRGHQFTITLDPKGKITKFEGYDSLIAKLSGNDAKVAKTLRAMLPVDFFKKTSEGAFTMMPDKAVKKGDAWQRETSMSMGPLGNFKAVHNFKYDGTENGLAVILSTPKLDYLPPTGDGAGLPFKIVRGNLKAENAKNRVLFDYQLGRLRQDTGGMQLEVEMVMEQSSVVRVLATKPGAN